MAHDPSRYGISRGQVSPAEQQEAERTYQRERRQESRWLAWCRSRGMSAAEATRFLQRQRTARQRRQAHTSELRGQAVLLCCGRWHPIVQMPYQTLCCGLVYFAQSGRHHG